MNTQLISIESTPIRYEMKVEPARLEIQNAADGPSLDINATPAKLNTRTKNIEVKLDTYSMRKSLGFRKVDDLVRENADRSKQHIGELTREYVQTGKALSRIDQDTTVADIVKQKAFQPSSSYTAFLPNGSTEISWVPNQITKDYEPGSMQLDWQLNSPDLRFVRATFNINILDYPKVEVHYLGGPSYVPPSADPNYEEGVG